MLRDWPPRSSTKDRETFGSVATQWSWRSYREQRSRRDEYHTVMLETDMMSTTVDGVKGERCSTARTARTASPDAACEGPCTQREVNRSSAERGAILEELQECVNQKILEATRNQTVNDGKHRDELPQTRRRKAVSVRDEAEIH